MIQLKGFTRRARLILAIVLTISAITTVSVVYTWKSNETNHIHFGFDPCSINKEVLTSIQRLTDPEKRINYSGGGYGCAYEGDNRSNASDWAAELDVSVYANSGDWPGTTESRWPISIINGRRIAISGTGKGSTPTSFYPRCDATAPIKGGEVGFSVYLANGTDPCVPLLRFATALLPIIPGEN